MALADLKVGAAGRVEVTIDDSHTAHAIGHKGVHVLGTPILTLFCEQAGGEAIKHAQGPGESTVGLHNDIWHLAAAKPGDKVVVEAKLIEIDGRKLKFELSGTVNGRPLVRGIHERVWVDLERFLTRERARG